MKRNVLLTVWTTVNWRVVYTGSLLGSSQNREIVNSMKASLPVGILWTDVHLQEDPLGERFEALATLPQVPVAEVTAQLACGGWARQDPLVL